MHPRTLPRLLAVAGATIALFSATAAVAADEIALTRDAVRAELVAARATGRLDGNGEAGATDAVIAARDRFNATESLANAANLAAAADLAMTQQRGDPTEYPGGPDVASYVEEGSDGPLLVLMIFDADGALSRVDTLSIASID